MLIFRYLAKEVFITLIALTTILILIFMSNEFVILLNRAAKGQIPIMLVLKLMMLQLPALMALLLPLGFFISILIAYGRLYAESEMTILQACGYGPRQLLCHTYIMAAVVASLVGAMVIWLTPLIAMERAKILRTSGVQTLIQTIVPGRFREISNGRVVFYVASMNRDHTLANQTFLARFVEKDGQPSWDIIWADKAFVTKELGANEDYLILEDGKQYQGVPGKANYQVAEFKRYKARLPYPTVDFKTNDLSYASTASLWPLNNTNLNKAAELNWRIAFPIMVLTLTLVAVPLSRVSPRGKKFGNLLPAIVICLVYANLIFVARDWIIKGLVPVVFGMWCQHLVVIMLGLLFFYRNQVKLS